MANALTAYVPELWANESLVILLENMVISNLVHKDFSNVVAQFGEIIHTRKPAEFTAKRKVNADSVTVQDASATDIEVRLNQHLHTSFEIKDGEESKSFKQLVTEYLQPAVQSIAQAIDKILLGEAHQFLANQAGGMGLVTAATVKGYMVNTRKSLNVTKAPEAGRNLIVTPTTEAAMLNLDTFTEADKVGDDGSALREASIGRKFGFNIYQCQNTPETTGIAVNSAAPLVDLTAGYAVGTTTIHVDVAGDQFAVGTMFKLGGYLYRTTAIGSLVTQDIDVTFTPGLKAAAANDDPIVVGGKAVVNLSAGYVINYAKEIVVDGYTGVLPVGALLNTAAGDIYSVIETTESSGNTIGITLNRPLDAALANNAVFYAAPPASHNFAFARSALALVSRPLAAAPEGLAISATASLGGVGIRVTITYNGTTQSTLVTVDLLCGVKVLDTDLGVVMLG